MSRCKKKNKLRAASDNQLNEPPTKINNLNPDEKSAKQNRKIGQEQCGFVKDTGTRNVTFIIRMTPQSEVQMQADVRIGFIDYISSSNMHCLQFLH